MGFQDGAADVRAFRRACAEGRVTPLASRLLRSAMSEARTVSDPAGNSKLCKGSQGGRRFERGTPPLRRRSWRWGWARANLRNQNARGGMQGLPDRLYFLVLTILETGYVGR